MREVIVNPPRYQAIQWDPADPVARQEMLDWLPSWCTRITTNETDLTYLEIMGGDVVAPGAWVVNNLDASQRIFDQAGYEQYYTEVE